MTHWVRVVMDDTTRKFVAGLEISKLSVLEISGGKWSSWEFGKYESTLYPEFDICTDYLDRQFDLIIAEQVWEHLTAPSAATSNVLKMLRPGGWFLNTTPFLLKRHDHPIDCYRWTEIGMKHHLIQGGFEESKVITGSWGNKACTIANLDAWVSYLPEHHSLENDPKFPLVVWAFAQR